MDQLRDYYAENGVLPSFAGIASLVGLKATSAVSVMVGRLKEAGFLVSMPDKRLAPGPRFHERLEIAESVRAGIPEAMVDVGNDPVLIDRLLVEEPSCTVIVTIQGDSMIDAGLLDGDKIVVKRGVPSKVGDIVVAIVDGEFTVKYLAKDARSFYLKPGNEAFDDIRPQEELKLFGRVTGCFRIY
ncbi:LexA family protein [Vreelandella sp. V005]|uniref:LexA family protein n=1 Tax=Vreelandella sp. V005 TaxID=3459608 RepID=UPI004044D3ED